MKTVTIFPSRANFCSLVKALALNPCEFPGRLRECFSGTRMGAPEAATLKLTRATGSGNFLLSQ